jgi:polysaccharide biosynthesis transport protein
MQERNELRRHHQHSMNGSTQGSEGVDLAGLAAALRRRVGWIVLAVVLTTVATVALSRLQDPQYEATASLLFRDAGLGQEQFGATQPQIDPAREAETNFQLANLDVVAARTAAALDGNLTPAGVEQRIKVAPEGESNVVSVTATDRDPEQAALLASTFADEFIEFRREADRSRIEGARRLAESQLDRLPENASDTRLRELEGRAADLRILASLQTGNTELVQRAAVPESPSSPQPVRNGLIGAFAGLLLGLALALVFEQVDRRLKRPRELEEAFDLPLIGSVPKSRALADVVPGEGLPAIEAEAFRMLNMGLRYSSPSREVRSVVVTSPAPEDGKSTVAFHLAVAAHEAGARVLLIEADLRRPGLADALDLTPGGGLASILSDPNEKPAAAIQRVPVTLAAEDAGPTGAIDVMVAGEAAGNPTALMASERMFRLIRQAEKRYDLVVIDTPPAGIIADAIPLMDQVGGVVIVSRLDADTRDAAARLREQLDKLDAPTLGVVANFDSPDDRIEYGRYLSGSGGSGASEREPAAA